MLKYLFKVEFKDGTTYLQNPEDISVSGKLGESCYFDIKDKDIKTFSLIGEHTYLVDLTDGHFEIDGIPFKIRNKDLNNFRLVYARVHSATQTTEYKLDENLEIQTDKGKTYDRIKSYLIGWQTNDEFNNNIKEILEIC